MAIEGSRPELTEGATFKRREGADAGLEVQLSDCAAFELREGPPAGFLREKYWEPRRNLPTRMS